MTVAELIKELEKVPQNLTVYAEGEPANKVLVVTYKGEPLIVRIFKTWGVEFIDSPLSDMRGDDRWNY